METATLGQKRRRKNQNGSTMSDETAPKKPRNDTSAIVKLFQGFQAELDSRHDKHERIVKLSRDVTIQSKRVIFLLHRVSDDQTRAETLQAAAGKFIAIKELFKKIARELLNEDCFQFIRAYSPGLQEFIEAYSFWYYLKHGSIVSFEKVCLELVFDDMAESIDPNTKVPTPPGDTNVSNPPDVTKVTKLPTIAVHIPPAEYILGISDLTGELMRLAINSVGQGNLTMPLKICQVLRQIHDEFIMFGNQQRGLPKKLEVLKNSLKKVENTCYTIHVRGSEVPKNIMATLIASNTDTVN